MCASPRGPYTYPLEELRQVRLQLLSVNVFCHPVDANGLASIKAPVALTQQVQVDDVPQIGEHQLRFPPRLHFYTGEFRSRRFVHCAVLNHAVSLASVC